jgi:5-methylcytosine-specific restriction endonuclease McrA
LFEVTKINPNEELLCTYCGIILELTDSENELNKMSLDHRLPKYWNGKNTVDNLVPCCNLCNTIKSTPLVVAYKIS